MAGLGGGPSKIIILMLMLNYSMKESTSHIYPFILGGTLANNLINVMKKHPLNPKKPIIDFNLALLLFPNLLLGSSIGV